MVLSSPSAIIVQHAIPHLVPVTILLPSVICSLDHTQEAGTLPPLQGPYSLVAAPGVARTRYHTHYSGTLPDTRTAAGYTHTEGAEHHSWGHSVLDSRIAGFGA